MGEILAACDVSGNPNLGNYVYMGIVVGTKENIESIVRSMGNEQIHMSQSLKKNQNVILSKLKIDNNQNTALCAKINRDQIIKKIQYAKKIRHKNISSERIFRTYNYLLFQQLREIILKFLIKHKCDLSDIVFECDSDCINFVKDNGLKYTCRGKAHMLADIVAWANNRNKEPDGVITLDSTKLIEDKLIKILGK